MRRIITVKNISLQFDTYHEDENVEWIIQNAINMLNAYLKREPYDMDAQLFVDSGTLDFDVEEGEET